MRALVWPRTAGRPNFGSVRVSAVLKVGGDGRVRRKQRVHELEQAPGFMGFGVRPAQHAAVSREAVRGAACAVQLESFAAHALFALCFLATPARGGYRLVVRVLTHWGLRHARSLQ